jgi:hypothetical protein
MSGWPDEDDEELPRRRRRGMRLDCEPHRGDLVRLLGTASLVLGVLAICGGVTGLVGLPLGVAAWKMARDDLAKMRAGTMDRRGEKKTRRGGDNAVFGILLSLLFVAVYTLFVLNHVLPPPYGMAE